MKCSEVHNNLTDFIEGLLDKENEAEVQEHLGHCHNCGILAERVKESFSILEKEKEVDFDHGFISRVESRMEETRVVQMNPVFRIARIAVAAAIVILGIFSGINIGRITHGTSGAISTDEFSEEFYSLNDIYKEPIETFFILNIESDEQD